MWIFPLSPNPLTQYLPPYKNSGRPIPAFDLLGQACSFFRIYPSGYYMIPDFAAHCTLTLLSFFATSWFGRIFCRSQFTPLFHLHPSPNRTFRKPNVHVSYTVACSSMPPYTAILFGRFTRTQIPSERTTASNCRDSQSLIHSIKDLKGANFLINWFTGFIQRIAPHNTPDLRMNIQPPPPWTD